MALLRKGSCKCFNLVKHLPDIYIFLRPLLLWGNTFSVMDLITHTDNAVFWDLSGKKRLTLHKEKSRHKALVRLRHFEWSSKGLDWPHGCLSYCSALDTYQRSLRCFSGLTVSKLVFHFRYVWHFSVRLLSTKGLKQCQIPKGAPFRHGTAIRRRSGYI